MSIRQNRDSGIGGQPSSNLKIFFFGTSIRLSRLDNQCFDFANVIPVSCRAMNLIRYSDARYEAKLARLAATSSLFDPLIEQRTLDIIRGVERDGDKAVLNYTRQFDGASLRATDLAICLLYTSPSPRDLSTSRMPSSA